MQFFLRLLIILLSAVGFIATSHAANLIDVYYTAVQTDTVLQSAKATYLAATEALPQARSAFLPNLGLIGTTATTDLHILSRTPFTLSPRRVKYSSYEYTLSLNQNVFNFATWGQMLVADDQVKQAAAVYGAAAQDLILRVAQAYFDILLADDTLKFISAQEKAVGKQLEQAEEKYKVGLGTITSVYNAKASYDEIRAQKIFAHNETINNREKLRQITGIYFEHLAPLKSKFPLLTPDPNNIEAWVLTGTDNNFTLQASRFAAKVARDQIKVDFAGHLPVVTANAFVDRYSSNQPINLTVEGNDLLTKQASLQLSMPIFQGGYVMSKVRQAQHYYDVAIADMKTTYLKTVVDTRQTYNDIINGINKIQADRLSVLSAESSVSSTDESVKAGTRTIVDLLTAQQNLFSRQKNLAADQYRYLYDTLKLKQLAGILSDADIEAMCRWLEMEYKKD